MSQANFTIRAVQLEDVPAIAQLSADAFETDRQTQLKGLGKEPYDMRAETLRSLPELLRNRRCVVLKAVETQSGEIMGYCTWGFRGLERGEMPIPDGGSETEAPAQPPRPVSDESAESPVQPQQGPPPPESDPVKRLEARTGADLQAWMAEVMPDKTRCLFVVGLSVSPRQQSRGVGSALLRWGTRVCDDRDAFAWVHSSEPAWGMYQKSGFETVRSLDIDLDEYAPAPPPGEGPDARWGHYVFRYMKYLPRAGAAS
ncbi:hypothetical protein CDD83_3001 [Cordyceps sp. RAO-2017]|nr:hypothetical protein CDD83_3001 [Cordyceps sp. RAO-2017]